eukprot:TRINITY_DN3724_c0_g1_i1.p1 TRINITY_DN3724_c0_g1~~TRINITY_DN3724_c0_g1_i1.p1  ORF type:complete len:254 (-),score=91.24 TRINITY_DN3724_c0_g1_i1:85-738(-)
MKTFLFTFLVVLACVSADPTSEAEAEAEAKPYVGYPYGLGYPSGVGYTYGYPGVRSYGYHAASPLVYGARPYYSAGHYIGKREAEAAPEAEADPEADPWLAYGYGHPYAYSGLSYPYRVLPTLKKVEKVEAKPVTYALRPYGAYPYGVHHPLVYSHHLGKREAEATPEANPEAEADPWFTYGNGAYPYRYGYAGYAPTAYNSAYRGYHAYPSYPFYG